MSRRVIATIVALIGPMLLLLGACDLPTSLITAIPAQGTVPPIGATPTIPATGLDRIPLGTWGGDNVALIHEPDRAHMHWDCVVGEVFLPLTLDAGGNFDLQGTYNPDAYPVDRGTEYPARYTGHTDGKTLTVTVTDTRNGTQFGPFKVVLGEEPRMQECPVCAPGH